MAVKHEIKSQLAKLLATEDLIVEHKQVPTAQFNVHTRVLTLPLWELASNDVYDMLVGHEVAHALFTPDQDPPADIPHQFVNVVEDARIEKLMKRRYMGIAKSFYKGYSELHRADFFEIENEDIDTFNLADRANLYFKIGTFLDLSFSTREKEIIDLIGKAETFEEVEEASRVLYEYCKEQQEEQKKKVADIDSHQQVDMKLEERPNLGEDDTEYEDEEKEEVEGKSPQSPQMEESGDSQPSTDLSDDLEVQTAESLEDKLQDLINRDGVDNVYVQIPDVNLDTIIGSNEDVHRVIDESFDAQQAAVDNRKGDELLYMPVNLFEEPDSEFVQFKREAQKEVNYLVKEFECKKAASAYARATTARTGIIDTSKLHTYKYNEDLFKKITSLPDGKNHGLVFILDWSGSMQNVLEDTLKQLYNLIWFCKKVHIPFDVYAFTNEWRTRTEDVYRSELTEHYKAEEGLACVGSEFSLMNVLTSKVNVKELEHQMINMWRLAHAFGNRYHVYYRYPDPLVLSGTPLNESMIALHKILPKFQKENNVEKVQCIVLTDGEANYLPYHKSVDRRWEEYPYMGARNINPNTCFLRDKKVGKTYKFHYGYHQFTATLLENLKDRFPSVNFIGIRLLSNKEGLRFARMYYPEGCSQYGVIERDWRKTKSYTLTEAGYDAYFVMSSNTLSQDTEFEVAEDATKGQIKKAFVKSLKVKKLNKKVLGEFISLVA